MRNHDNPARVLIIDDDRAILRMYSDIMSAEGFITETDSSAIDAIERLQKGEKFDLVITDIMMARLDGWELLRNIRQEMKLGELELPVIIVSAFVSDTLEAKAFSCGANGSYVKGREPLTKLFKMVRIQTGRERSIFDDTTGAD